METSFHLLPPSASTSAGQVDGAFYFLLVVSVVMSAAIAAAIVYFSIKYRRGSKVDRSNPNAQPFWLEITWLVAPFLVMIVMFAWGVKIFLHIVRPPAGATEIHVVGKQWMWKFQHATGQREINLLHVPVHQPVRLTMISEDVIHDLFVPAFRVKNDVLPGRSTSLWFEANEVGEYEFFCSQYCGAGHSGMIGKVIVMTQTDFARWLSGKQGDETPQQAGARLFAQHGCNTCHRKAGEQGQCPPLEGVYGSRVPLNTGATVLADEAYLRESIVRPNAKIVAGYQPGKMPTFEKLISEEDLSDLVAYIKSLAGHAENPLNSPHPPASETPPLHEKSGAAETSAPERPSAENSAPKSSQP